MFCISSIDKTAKRLTPEAKKAAKALKKAMKGYTPVDSNTLKALSEYQTSTGKVLIGEGGKINLKFKDGLAMHSKKERCNGTFAKILSNGDKVFLKYNEGKIQSSIRTGEKNFIKIYEYSNSDPHYAQSMMISKYDLNHQLRDIMEIKKSAINGNRIELTKYNKKDVTDKTIINTTSPYNDPIKEHMITKNGNTIKYIQVGTEKPILAEVASEKI